MGTKGSKIGYYLKHVRISLNYSLRKAAQLSGLSHGYIRDVELGDSRTTGTVIIPQPNTLRKFAVAYGVSYENLMNIAGYTDNESTNSFKPISLEIDLKNVLYIQVDDDNKVKFHTSDNVLTEPLTFQYSHFEKTLELNHFVRLRSGLFANLLLTKSLTFTPDAFGNYLEISWNNSSKEVSVFKKSQNYSPWQAEENFS